jgi:polar amino acid transport system ATP-binding protein
MISVRKVGKSYGAHRVLDDVSLEVDKGEVVCIIGPSGSGKSTLLRCINGLEHYDEGAIAIDGTAVHRE